MKKVLLLGICSLFVLNEAHAGKFKEVPINEKEAYLQYDDDEGRRGYGFTIEIGKIDRLLQELEDSIKSTFNKGYQIVGVDFSNSDLTNEKFQKINSFIEHKVGKLNYNLDETDVDLFKDPIIMKGSKIYEEETEDSLEIKQKTPHQGFKCEVLRSIKITPSQIKSLYEDSDEDM